MAGIRIGGGHHTRTLEILELPKILALELDESLLVITW